MLFDLVKLLKKELLVLNNSDKFSQTINILKANNIPYWTRIENISAQSSDRRKRGMGYHSSNPQMFYYIYVSKKHFEKALYVINKNSTVHSA